MSSTLAAATSDSEKVALINGRLDRMPVWGLSRAVYIVLGLCYLLAFYDIAVIGAALPRIVVDMHLSTAEIGLPLTSNLVGYIVGAYFLGGIADRLGRRLSLAGCIIILTVGAIITAFSWDILSLTIFRFITGIGIGAQIAVTATILSELAPAARRGRYMSMAIMWAAAGNIVPTVIAIPLLALGGSIGWRLLFLFPAVIIFTLVLFNDRMLPESPRWLAVHGRFEHADRIVGLMEDRIQRWTRKPLSDVAGDVARESEQLAEHAFATRDLFTSRYIGRLAAVFCFWVLFYIAVYGFIGFEPTLLKGLGANLPHALLIAAVGYVGGVVGAGVLPLTIDRWERKYSVMGGLGVFMLGFLCLALAHHAAWVAIGSFLTSAGIFLAIIPAYAYTSEVFPTRARGSAMGVADGWGHIGGAVAPFIVLPVLTALGARAAFGALLVSAAISLIIMFFARRTTKRTLPELAQ